MKPHIFHKWSKWSEPYLSKTIWVDQGGVETSKVKQSRTCKLCNKIETRNAK